MRLSTLYLNQNEFEEMLTFAVVTGVSAALAVEFRLVLERRNKRFKIHWQILTSFLIAFLSSVVSRTLIHWFFKMKG